MVRDIGALAPRRAVELTFSGSCVGGDRYLIHLLVFKEMILELHVSTLNRFITETQLHEAMRTLLGRARHSE